MAMGGLLATTDRRYRLLARKRQELETQETENTVSSGKLAAEEK
jgi:hypothetical protein